MTDFANNKIKQCKACKYLLSSLFYLAVASAAGKASAQTTAAGLSYTFNRHKKLSGKKAR